MYPGWSHDPTEHFPDMMLIERYWLRETSPEETAVLEIWLASHPEWKARYTQLQEGLKTDTCADLSGDELRHLMANVLHVVQDRSEVQVAVQASVDIAAAQSSAARSNMHSTSVLKWMGRVIPSTSRSPFAARGMAVAVLSLFFVLAVGLSWLLRDNDKNIINAEATYSAGIGQRITVILTDGSRVTLAPQTTIRVPSTFGTTLRSVFVQGEALFDIASTTQQPFVVQAGTVQARVLGTRFTVKAYPDDQAVHVAVESGKVSVDHSHGTPALLTAGRVALITDSGATVTDVTTPSEYTDWINGQLTFRRAPLRDVLATLSRWYGVEFRIADSLLAGSHLTGTFLYGSLDDMLEALKVVLPVVLSYERQDDGMLRVVLRSAHPKAPVLLHPESMNPLPSLSER